jgi:hypothetical protein
LSFTIEIFDDPETGKPNQYGRFSRKWQDWRCDRPDHRGRLLSARQAQVPQLAPGHSKPDGRSSKSRTLTRWSGRSKRQVKGLCSQERLRIRQEKSQPLVQTLNRSGF